MNKSLLTVVAVTASALTGVARADYPMVDAIANKVIAKYQNATCQQLWEEKAANQGKPKPAMEQRAIQVLHEDAGARAEFFSKVSAPIVTKMFECGMIP